MLLSSFHCSVPSLFKSHSMSPPNLLVLCYSLSDGIFPESVILALHLLAMLSIGRPGSRTTFVISLSG